MTEADRNRSDGENPEAAELRALAAKAGPRVEWARVGGRKVWVKRFVSGRPSSPKRLHALVSPLLPVQLRSSLMLDAEGMTGREARKIARFAAAGFPVPEVLWRERGVLVLSDMGPSVQARLARLDGNDPAHAALIAGCAAALGRLHAAGLCHGRPHPRDMCVAEDGRVGFLDFEEEPEAVIPLAASQARDLWQFFLHVSLLAVAPGTLEAALAAYRAAAPKNVLPELKPLLRMFRPAVALGLVLPAGLVHHDYQRIVAASQFLQTIS